MWRIPRVQPKFCLPYLDLGVDTWIVRIRTFLFHKRVEMNVLDYILLEFRFWGGKWGFHFRLYSPKSHRI